MKLLPIEGRVRFKKIEYREQHRAEMIDDGLGRLQQGMEGVCVLTLWSAHPGFQGLFPIQGIALTFT